MEYTKAKELKKLVDLAAASEQEFIFLIDWIEKMISKEKQDSYNEGFEKGEPDGLV